MKILYVSTLSDTINAFLVPHIHLLMDSGHTVDLACNVSSPINPTLLKRGCRVYPMSFQRSPLKKNNYGAYQNLKKLIEDGKYDWVHTHTPVASTLTRLACRGLKDVKIIYTAHGFHFFEGAPMKNWLVYYPIEKWLARRTDMLITMNSEDYARAKSKLKAKNIQFVNGVGVNLNRFSVQDDLEKIRLRKEYAFDKDAFILVYAADLCYGKHQDILIEAVGKLVGDIPDIKLLLMGKGPNDKLYRDLIEQLGLGDHVQLMGYRNDINQLMMLADVSVSASRREGLPVNVMEAMATGLPLVVSNCRGNADLVKDGKNGFVITDDSPYTYAAKISQIYKDKELSNSMKKANLVAIQKYSTENVLKEMERVYRELLG